MKTRLILLTSLSVALYGGVRCEDASGQANGEWRAATAWDGKNRLTCADAVRPVYYRLSNDGEPETANRIMQQDVFNDAWLGDFILYTAGHEFHITNVDGSAGVLITARPGAGWLTVTTTEYAKLPYEGTRVTPAYAPLMPKMLSRYQSPGFGFRGGSPGPPENIYVRGLHFTVHPDPYGPAAGVRNPNLSFVHGFLRIGGTGGRYNPTINVMTADQNFWHTRTTRTTAQGASVLHLQDASNLKPGMKLLNGDGQNATYVYTIAPDGVDTNNPNDHKVNLIEGVPASFNPARIQVLDTIPHPDWQPDNIFIQQCLFTNPQHKFQVGRFILVTGRNTTIRDSYFSAPLATSDSSANNINDSQTITGDPIGPTVIENNFLDGGSETIMFGGQYGPFNDDFRGATIRYNFLCHVPERDYTWTWDVTQDAGLWNTLTGTFLTRTYSPMSLSGLPANSPRLVFSGRHVTAPVPNGIASAGGPWYRALNTGVVGTTVPPFGNIANGQEIYDVDPARMDPSLYGQTLCKGDQNGVQSEAPELRDGDGVCWRRTNNNNSHPFIKNNFELKRGKNITLQHNVFDWHGPMHNVNVQQAYIFVLKASGSLGNPTLLPNACIDGLGFPACYKAETRDINVLNNVFRGFAGGLLLTGTEGVYGPPPSRNGGYTIRGNLFIQTERPHIEQYAGYRFVTAFENTPTGGNTRAISLPDIRIENNSFFSKWIMPGGSNARVPFSFGGSRTSGGFDGVRSFVGNIWNRWTQGSFSAYETLTGDWTNAQTQWFPGTTTGGVWGKNVILGAASSAFPAEDLVWTGCGGSAACIESPTDTLDWSSVFANAEGGDFQVRDDHWGKRAMPDGSDIGADTAQLPILRDLNVTPSDRSVVFQWSVTAPILNVPCVVEVHNAPDFESTVWQGKPAGYAGELSDIRNYYRQDADDAPQNVRNGAVRTLVVGHAISLNASTTYFYRLHCGGDVRRGSFTTLEALPEETTQTIARGVSHPSAKLMEVEYGTSFDRSTGTLANSRTAVSACVAGEPCSVSFPFTSGKVVYYRWIERDHSGQQLVASEAVSVLVAR